MGSHESQTFPHKIVMAQLIVKHPWLGRLALLATSVATLLLGIEMFIRIAGMDSSLLWQPDPYLGWSHIPGAKRHWTEEGDGWVEINALGMRDVERTVAKGHGVFRIAVFGDSVTEAVQVNVDQTFCQILESRLRARGIRAEVLNFGVNGYSPLQEYLLYQTHGKAFEPDVVIHAVFLDNDIADGDRMLASGDRGAPFIIDSSSGTLTVDHSLAEASHLQYTRQPVYALRRVSATYRAVSAVRSAWRQRRFASAATTSNTGIPRRYLLYETPVSDRWQRAWGGFERIVSQFAREVRAEGAKYVILSATAGQIVNESAWTGLLDAYPAMRQRRWQLLAPDGRLRELAAKEGLDLITSFEAFRRSAGQGSMFFGQVGHLTPHGHEIMAATVEEALVGRGLLPLTSQAHLGGP